MKKKLFIIAITVIILVIAGIFIYNFTKGTSQLESEYFTIENGAYVNDSLPVSENGAELISDLQLNKTVINGGSNIINFTSSILLDEALINAKGISGYINVPLQYTYDEASRLYKYSMTLLLSQKLSEAFDFGMVVKAKDGTISKPYNTNINVMEAGTGALQISLSWNLDDDVDLHVFEPDGTEIYYAAPFSFPDDMDMNKFYFDRNVWIINKYKSDDNYHFDRSSTISKLKLKALLFTLWGKVNMRKETALYMRENNIPYSGELDIDSNAACNIDGIRNENIFYIMPEPGTYTVKINLFSKCKSARKSTEGTKYAVTIKYDNKDMKLDTGKDNLSGQFPQSMESNSNNKEGLVEICTFTIPGERKPYIEKEKIDTDMSTYFDKLSRLID